MGRSRRVSKEYDTGSYTQHSRHDPCSQTREKRNCQEGDNALDEEKNDKVISRWVSTEYDTVSFT